MNARSLSASGYLAAGLGLFLCASPLAAPDVHQGASAAIAQSAPSQSIDDVMRLARRALYGPQEGSIRGLFLASQEQFKKTERTYQSPARLLIRSNYATGQVFLSGIDGGAFVGTPPTQRELKLAIRDLEVQLWQVSLGFVLNDLDTRVRLRYDGLDKTGDHHLVHASAVDGVEFDLTLDRQNYRPVQVAEKGGWTMVFEDFRPIGSATLPYLIRVLDYQGQPFMTWRVERYQLNPEWPASAGAKEPGGDGHS